MWKILGENTTFYFSVEIQIDVIIMAALALHN